MIRKTRAKDMTGLRCGCLTVVARDGRKGKAAAWRCLCDCGKETKVLGKSLRTGRTRSCGCLSGACVTHGLSQHPLYSVWHAMISRCTNKKSKSYRRYGERGIRVCERWMVLENFISDMGKRPNGMTLDRKDNDGDYCPENCRWATKLEQANNTCCNVFIETSRGRLTIAQISRIADVNQEAIRYRIKRGVTGERLFAARSVPGPRKKKCKAS